MTPEEFRQHGHELVDWIAEYLSSVHERRVQPNVRPGDVLAQLPAHPPTSPESFEAVMADVDQIVLPALTHWQHPSFFAYFPSNITYPSVLGELLGAGLGVQGMSWVTSPACTELEIRMLDWMGELLGLPAAYANTSLNGGGVIQGSASEATLVAILSARHRATSGVINDDGDTTNLVAYATDQAHSGVEKGLRIAGVGTARLRVIPHDRTFAMRPDALADRVAADRASGLTPFLVVATHGTTSSTAFDPTPEIGAICRSEHIWLHVDAAMSGIAAVCPELRWVNHGLELADSYCTNAHKWMGINFDCDLFWTSDRTSLLGALSILPEYLRSAASQDEAARDLRDWQIPLGRRFRSLKLWLSLRLDGIAPVQEVVRRHVGLTRHLASIVDADDRFEVMAPHPLNLLVLAVDAATAGSLGEANRATDAIIERVNDAGDALFTRTVLDGRTALRFSIGNRTTERSHVDDAWQLIRRTATDVLSADEPSKV